ncbi:protein of unknown function [Petrocella atlantisensis]|uniref:Uncharacterized protein n=1 Tax=Petrocella atlantisensis TaxID=2173034 RepID=A0A3P7P886_9FIRM|nr:protein of unknown function [Petrocella atlantisensis]
MVLVIFSEIFDFFIDKMVKFYYNSIRFMSKNLTTIEK